MLEIQIANQQQSLPLDEARLAAGCRAVLEGEGIDAGQISLAVVDDKTIRELNRKYLGHDYATDVISFVLEDEGQRLEGEVVVSAETAMAAAERFGWAPHDELLLYVVHGTLHLCGYDDLTDEALPAMRAAERRYLAEFGLTPEYADRAELSTPAGRLRQGDVAP